MVQNQWLVKAMSNGLTVVTCSRAAAPGGHYQQAVIHKDTIYVSGQLGVLPFTSTAEQGDIRAQAHHALSQIEAILGTVGCGLKDIVRTTAYVSRIEDWDTANAVFAERFGDWKPARTIVPCSGLHHGALVEIDAIAAIR
jgi:reactive intermediate/imine deaminase